MSPRQAIAEWLHPRPLPLVALQLVGLVALMIAAWMIRDGWYALGTFGLALLAVGELANRQG